MTLPSLKYSEPPQVAAAGARAICARYDQAAAARENWRSLWQDSYDLTLPELARFSGAHAPGGQCRTHLYDGTAPDAVDQLAASLLGQLTPPWVNWVGLAPGADIDPETRARLTPLLASATSVIQDQIDRSNLHMELHQCFLDLVVGGTACLHITENPVGASVAFSAHAIPLSEMVLAPDSKGDLSFVYRPRRVKGSDLVQIGTLLSHETLESLLKKEDEEFEIIEFCEKDGDRYTSGAVLRRDPHGPELLYSAASDFSPYITFRWTKIPGEAYGRSPVMKALPDIRTANKVVELILKNASIAVTGMWQAEDDGVLNPANIELVPGAIIPKAVGSAGLKPLEMPGRFDVSQLVLDDLRARIRHALLADRFAQIETSARLTATEVRERADEATLILGAIYGRLQSELLTPLLTLIYHILRRRGEIPDLPLDGRMVQLAHRSPIARARVERGLRGIMTWVDAVSTLGAGAAQTVNTAAVTRYLAETLGVPDELMIPAHPDPTTLTTTESKGA